MGLARKGGILYDAGMRVHASLRLKGADTPQLPAGIREQGMAAAKALERHGIDVLHVGRRSVSVAADSQQFEEALGVHVEPNQAAAVPVQASDDELNDLLDLVEVASPALTFSR